MDTDRGRFVEDDKAEPWMKRIAVGETIKIKGEEVVVVVIGPSPERGLSEREMIVALKSSTDRMLDEEAAEERSGELRRSLARDGNGFIGNNAPMRRGPQRGGRR